MEQKKRAYRITSKLIAFVTTLVLTCVLAATAWTVSGIAGPGITTPDADLNYTTMPGVKRLLYTQNYDGIQVECSSVELDLGISVFFANGELATGIAFEFSIVNTKDATKAITAMDEDKDGQIYIEKIDEGDYTVKLLETNGIKAPDPVQATVEPKVTYKKVDVADKVKKASEVDQKNEDSQYGGGTNDNGGSSGSGAAGGTSNDTVEYVASSQSTTTKETEKPVLDASGNQVYKYKPTLTNGFLTNADGTQSDITPVLDDKGYFVSANRAGVDCTAEVLDAAGVPLTTDGTNYKFKFEKVALTEIVKETITVYYGWQTLNGKTYYFDKNGKYVTGWQTIQGIRYFFTADGVRGGSIGVDVSTWQGSIDWAKVKAAGVDFAILRLGFRGYGSGALVLDNTFQQNIRGATAAGLKVGVYFFTQAINEREAVEEASMCLQYVSGYSLAYPIAIDIEDAGSSTARTNSLTTEQRTKICIAFCETIRNSGYKACVYANKNWFETKLYASQLSQYIIWLAHYTTATSSSYGGRYDIWQHTSTGKVNGISGNTDMNISYLGY